MEYGIEIMSWLVRIAVSTGVCLLAKRAMLRTIRHPDVLIIAENQLDCKGKENTTALATRDNNAE